MESASPGTFSAHSTVSRRAEVVAWRARVALGRCDEPPAARWQVHEYPSPPPPPAPPPPQKKLLLSNEEVVRRLATARRTGVMDTEGLFG